MVAGTWRRGETRPGSTRWRLAWWQRLYLRPLPHQQGSFDLSGALMERGGSAPCHRTGAAAGAPTAQRAGGPESPIRIGEYDNVFPWGAPRSTSSGAVSLPYWRRPGRTRSTSSGWATPRSDG